MARYLCKSSIVHNGKEYARGEVIELSEEQAAAMPWAVEMAAAPASAEKTFVENPPAKKSK